VELFTSAQLFRLDKQYRTLDPLHTKNLEVLRTSEMGKYPFASPHFKLSLYKFLKKDDPRLDVSWYFAPIAVLLNKVR
jgi:hypothetical protein